MKAQSQFPLLKLLSAAALVALPLLAGGCIAQAGAGTEDPGSTEQGLSSGAGTAVATQPEQQNGLPTQAERRSNLAEKFTSSSVVKPGGLIETSNPPGTDPGGGVMDDGDGREPDPHPWHSSLQRVAH